MHRLLYVLAQISAFASILTVFPVSLKAEVSFCSISAESLTGRECDLVTSESGDPFFIRIHGAIGHNDCDDFVGGIVERQRFPRGVWIFGSPGGDVRSATCIGDVIRQTGLHTYLEGNCSSACVLIWGAGVERSASSIRFRKNLFDDFLPPLGFGLHRPTIEQQHFANLSPDEARQQYAQLEAVVRDYMRRMDFPTEAIDRMMKTKSSDVDLIPSQEFVDLVGEHAPAHQEWLIARCGELSESEQRDWHSINKSAFSEGYIEYLGNQVLEIEQCKYAAIQPSRDKFLSESRGRR